MPVIPEWVRREGLAVTPLGGPSPLEALAGPVAATAQQFQAWRDNRLAEQQRQQEVAWQTTTLATARSDWTTKFLDARDAAPAGAPEFTEGLIGAFDQALPALLESAPTEGARVVVEGRLADLRSSLLIDATTFEGAERGRKLAADTTAALDLNAATVRRDPLQFEAVLLETTAGIRALALPAAAKEELERDAAATLALAAINAGLDRDPAAVKRGVLAGSWSRYIDPGTAERVIGQADTELRRREAEARARAAEARAEFMADFRFRLDDEQAARARGETAGLDDAEIVRALGPERGNRVVAELGATRAAAIDATSLALLAPAEQDALIQSYAPGGENYAAEAGRFDALTAARDRVRQAWTRDPAGAALGFSPALRTAFDEAAAANDPARLQQAVELSLQLQETAGVPAAARRPLAEGQAARLVADTVAAPGEQAADAIEGLAAGYGRHWPAVFRQLVDAGLPAPYRVLATIEDPAVRKTLAETLALPEADVKPADSTVARDIAAAVESRLADFGATLWLAPDGPSVLADYGDAARRLAFRYAAGSDPDTAVERAVAEVTRQWDIVVDDGIQARAPAGAGDQVADWARYVAEKLTPADLADPGGSPELTPDDRREQYLDAALGGTWVTNPDDNGWLLLDTLGQPVRRAGGGFVGFGFADVRGMVLGADRGRIVQVPEP